MSIADTRARAALAQRFRDAADLIDAVSAMDAVATGSCHASNGSALAGLEVKSPAAEASTASRGRGRGRPTNQEKASRAPKRGGIDVAARPALKLRRGERGAMIRTAILKNPKARAVDLASELGVSASHISTVRKEMREAGEIGNSDGSSEPAEKAQPPPLTPSQSRQAARRDEKKRDLLRAARAAAKSGELAHDIFGDGPASLVASGLYTLLGDEVDRIDGGKVNAAIQAAIYSRAEKLRERWNANHERKANNYFVEPMEYERLPMPPFSPLMSLRERFE
jgi:hypothetical protein